MSTRRRIGVICQKVDRHAHGFLPSFLRTNSRTRLLGFGNRFQVNPLHLIPCHVQGINTGQEVALVVVMEMVVSREELLVVIVETFVTPGNLGVATRMALPEVLGCLLVDHVPVRPRAYDRTELSWPIVTPADPGSHGQTD